VRSFRQRKKACADEGQEKPASLNGKDTRLKRGYNSPLRKSFYFWREKTRATFGNFRGLRGKMKRLAIRQQHLGKALPQRYKKSRLRERERLNGYRSSIAEKKRNDVPPREPLDTLETVRAGALAREKTRPNEGG